MASPAEAMAAAGLVPGAGLGESLLGLAARRDDLELLDVLSRTGLPVDGHPRSEDGRIPGRMARLDRGCGIRYSHDFVGAGAGER